MAKLNGEVQELGALPATSPFDGTLFPSNVQTGDNPIHFVTSFMTQLLSNVAS